MPVDLLSPTLAVSALRECLQGGQVKPTKHFLDELDDEEDLTIVDVWHVLKGGCVFDPPEPDIKTGDWKYKIEEKTPDGIAVSVIFCFKSADRVNLVTVFCDEKG